MPQEFSLEQFEAVQARKNTENSKLFETLNEEERSKIRAIEDATNVLLKAGIPAYIFAIGNNLGGKYPEVIQYNTVGALVKENSNGKMSKESKITNHLILKGVSCHLLNILMGIGCGYKEPQRTLHEAINIIYSLYYFKDNSQDPNLENLEKLEE